MASTAVTSAPAAARRLTRVSPWAVVVCAGTAVYTIGLSAESIYRQNHFMTGFDTAISDQFLWLAAHGHDLYSTIVDRSLLGDHFQPGLLLLTPLYWAGLGVPGLLAAQSLALALVAPALYALARDRGATPMLAAVPALLWLASPWTTSVNLYEFHPEVFVPALLVVSVLASLQKRWLILAATALLAMTFKDDVPFVYLMLGFVLVLSGSRRAGIVLAGASASFFVLAHEVVVHQGKAFAFFERRFAGDRGDTVAQAVSWMLRQPERTLLDVVEQSGWIVLVLLLATAGLALLAPRWLLLSVPTLLHNALSAYPLQHTLRYQYHLVAATGLFVAAAIGVPRVPRLTRPRRLVFAVAGCTAALIALLGGIYLHTPSTPRQKAGAARISKALSLIPPDASVAASIVLEPHLSHRVDLYTFPEPFIPIDWGGSSTAAQLEKRSRAVRFVAFVSGGGPLEYRRMRTVPAIVGRQGFVTIYRDGPVVVLERRN